MSRTERIPLLLREKHISNSLSARILRRRPLLWFLLIPLVLVAISVYNYIAKRSLVLALIGGISSLSSCTSCISLLVPLRSLAQLGDPAFVSALTAFCVRMNIQDAEVCAGAVGSQAPIIAHSLRSLDTVGGPSGQALCSKIFGLCKQPTRPPWTVPHRSPDPPNRPPKKESGKPPLQVVHISDIHVDREYKVGSEAKCKRAICCREHNELPIFYDPSAPIKEPAGPFGNRKCDAPLALFQASIDAINEMFPDAAFALYTGDSIDHAVWKTHRQDVESGIQTAYDVFRSLKMPVYGAIGNHDTSPTNSFPRRDSNSNTKDWDWVYSAHARAWNRSESEIVSTSGCYAVHDPSGVRLLVLNNNIPAQPNYWLYDSDEFYPDPNGILQWLEEQLQDAEDADAKAYIVGHVPPGSHDVLVHWNYAFNELTYRYRHTIPAQFYGHTHSSSYQVSYSSQKEYDTEHAFSINYVAGSLTPFSGNPVIRVYDVDPDTFAVMDFVDYVADLYSEQYQIHPKWEKFYSARQVYDKVIQTHLHNNEIPRNPLYPLNATYWHLVSEALEIDDKKDHRSERTSELERFARRAFRYLDGEHGRKVIRSAHSKLRWLDSLKNPPPPYKLRPGLHIDNVVMDDNTDNRNNIQNGDNDDDDDYDHSLDFLTRDYDQNDEDDLHLASMVHHAHFDVGTIMRQIMHSFSQHSSTATVTTYNNNNDLKQQCINDLHSILNR